MPKYFAVYKPHNSGPMSCTYVAPDVGHAIDKMYAYNGISRAHPDDEYDLMEIIDDKIYVPVAQKFKSKSPARQLALLPKEPEPQKQYSEKQYTSYRDVA